MTFWRGICETMKVAIIHYWLVGMRGGERVLERLCDLYPDADIFTHVHVPEAMSPTIRKMNVKTSFIQKLNGARKHYRSEEHTYELQSLMRTSNAVFSLKNK